MTYKGFTATVAYDGEDGILHGRVVDTQDLITFEADTVAGLEPAFHESVEYYLDWCRRRGKTPDRPFSGRFALRLPQVLHRALYVKAARAGESMNTYIARLLDTHIKQDSETT